MSRLLLALTLLPGLIMSGTVAAQQSQDFGHYVVHYNALNTNLIPPQVAQGYGIARSSSRALLNVTVLKKVLDTPGTLRNRRIHRRRGRPPDGALHPAVLHRVAPAIL
jgi:hypothetical protein